MPLNSRIIWHELLLQFVEHNFSWITRCNAPGSGFGNLVARLKKLDRLPWHHCRNFLLVHELRMRVPLQYDAEIIEPSNDPVQPNTIYQKDGDRRVVFEDMIQKHVLNVLRLFRRHEYPVRFLEPSRPSSCRQSQALGRSRRDAVTKMGVRWRFTRPDRQAQSLSIAGPDRASLFPGIAIRLSSSAQIIGGPPLEPMLCDIGRICQVGPGFPARRSEPR
jgi:hypothetical protein